MIEAGIYLIIVVLIGLLGVVLVATIQENLP